MCREWTVSIVFQLDQTLIIATDAALSAMKFEVSLAFLLQQAAWLYERQLVQVRAQMRKVGVSKGSAAPSLIPGSTSESVGGGEVMKRTGSGGGQSIPSILLGTGA
jgi:hypothetical protein